jgi:hypothetical protein
MHRLDSGTGLKEGCSDFLPEDTLPPFSKRFLDASTKKEKKPDQLSRATVGTERLIRLGAPGVTRTRGTRIRNPVLYPPELRGRRAWGAARSAWPSRKGDPL